ncbi:uncharacterized protein NECHADRAFT_75202 [Fusarium vanettenii 77-13-4]|uniref:Uncharacterized protein n=1 Tax=Fusarium vanettenii (strain ATCC MYA-4622 / CBS 123669 / FGSC 9596 / NRRL 45880 / 77-13-4) TaxID=660122 RepID=C7YI56_FUSV7|nr:uncharacterized protein NECHADRAFT_75202 [Fusarium vanettenii 77-13-4]EEU48038.1 predicted protein [Fusarium vanettenii 77-13-4]
MSDSKHPTLIGKELRNQLESHFDDLVKSGKVQLPAGTRICFDLEGIPKLVDVPYPAISKQRITRILDHISSNLFDRSAEWAILFSELNHLRNDEAARARFTHQQIWKKIRGTQADVEDDWRALGDHGDHADYDGHADYDDYDNYNDYDDYDDYGGDDYNGGDNHGGDHGDGGLMVKKVSAPEQTPQLRHT